MSKSSKLLTQIGSVAALCFMFVGFQNCGKQMHFSSLGLENSLKDSTLVEVPVDDGNSEDGNNDIVDNPVDNPVDDPGIIDNNDSTDNPPVDVVEDPVDHGNSGQDHSSDVPPTTNDNPGGSLGDGGSNDNIASEPDDSGIQNFICIIDSGHGKSQKLALVDNELVSQTSAVKTVCTTQRGCLEIASQKFNIASAEFRGFCKQSNDDHSVHLSESQLQEVVNNSN